MSDSCMVMGIGLLAAEIADEDGRSGHALKNFKVFYPESIESIGSAWH